MSRWRTISIITLFAIPIVVFGVLGAYALFERGWLFWMWFLLPICWGPAYLLSRRSSWNREIRQPWAVNVPPYWTERDREAWKIVEQTAKNATGIAPTSLSEPGFYLRSAQSLLLEVTRFYHPRANDPLAPVTIPELLTAARLALEDLSELVDTYVPGSGHLTVARWRSMTQFPKWYRNATNIGYFLSAAFGPAAAVGRFMLSKLVLGPAMQVMQDNVMYWFYAAFLQRVGLYAIELNSGRLRVGAPRWRALVEQSQRGETTVTADGTTDSPGEPETVEELTITVVGQLKAGKSSLVNALLGRTEAAQDALPATRSAARYEVMGEEWIGSLVIQDTAGYGGKQSSKQSIDNAIEASAESDIILLVADVLNAAREPDARFLRRYREWFASHPQFRRPPVIVVLTHVDLLSPTMEWSPPYEAWKGSEAVSRKDETIRDAVEHLRDEYPDAANVIPVCTGPASDRIYGVDDWLVPAILSQIEEARAVLLLRALHREGQHNLWLKLLEQTRNASTTILRKALGT